MSHDFESGMFVKQPAWHGLGIVLEDAPKTSEEAIQHAGLDWRVEKQEMYLEDGTMVPERFAMVRDMDKSVLGTVGQRYTVLQNHEAFDFFDPLIQDKIAEYETAGSLLGGRRVWILAKINGEIDLGSDDKIDKYVLLSNTHDGTGTVTCKVTPIRVVCNNTLTAALRATSKERLVGDEVKIRHTKNVNDRVKEAQNLLATVNEAYEKLENVWKQMTEFELPPVKTMNYMEQIFPDPENAENPQRTQKKRLQILELSKDSSIGGTLDTAQGTLWGAYNAVTAYADHVQSTRKGATEEKHLEDVWFGNRDRIKNKAFNVALNIMEEEGVELNR